MKKNEFKQGDKVATTKCYDIAINGYSTTIPIGEVGVIEDMNDNELYVYFSGYCVYLTLPISEVEPIQPLDRRTAFLAELQALLRKYDAEIEVEQTGYDSIPNIVLYADGGKGSAYYSARAGLTADNIMDFDKE